MSEINTEGLDPHPARAAAWMPIVKGKCPSCGTRSLFLAAGGYVTCANVGGDMGLGCANPTAAHDLLVAGSDE